MTKLKMQSYRQMKIKAKITYQIWRKLEQEKLTLSMPADDMPKTANKRTLVDAMAECDKVAQEYYKTHQKASQALVEVERFISSLNNPLHENIMQLKYVEGKPWWKVAKELNYSSERHLRDIHDKILEKNKIQPTTAI